MKNETLPIISISLSKEEAKQFKQLCEEESRGPSSMVRHWMKLYVESKGKTK